MLEIKNFEAKDLEVKDRTVRGYFSVFDFKDSDEDVITKGAFSKTLKEMGDRIAHLSCIILCSL